MERYKKIYALCDFELLKKFNFTFESYISKIEKFDIVYIQYRDKVNDIQTLKQNLLTLKSLTDIPIIINDHIELLDFADGLHMGQEDFERIKNEKFKIKDEQSVFKLLRKKYPNKIFGLSTHNEIEILQANKLDLDYIGLGAYRTTSTKDVKNMLGEKIVYLASISKHKVGAIGGVKIEDNIKNIAYNVIGSALLK